MKRPRPSKGESSWGRAVGPGLLIPAGLAGAVGTNGCSPGPDGRGASPVQAVPASDATDPDGPDSISGGMPAVTRNGAVSCVNDPVAVSRIGGESSKVGRLAPHAESAARFLADPRDASLTPLQEAPYAEVSRTPTLVELPNGVGDALVTWTKLSDDFSDDCWTLSSDAFRLHVEALVWSNRKLLDLLIPKDDLRRFAKDPSHVTELLDCGWWTDLGPTYRVNHHAQYQRLREDVVKQQAANVRNGRKGGRPRKPGREQASRLRPETQSVTDSVGNPESERDGPGQGGSGRSEGESRSFPEPRRQQDDLPPEQVSRLDALRRARAETGWES